MSWLFLLSCGGEITALQSLDVEPHFLTVLEIWFHGNLDSIEIILVKKWYNNMVYQGWFTTNFMFLGRSRHVVLGVFFFFFPFCIARDLWVSCQPIRQLRFDITSLLSSGWIKGGTFQKKHQNQSHKNPQARSERGSVCCVRLFIHHVGSVVGRRLAGVNRSPAEFAGTRL